MATRREVLAGGAALAVAAAAPAAAAGRSGLLDEHDALGLAGLVRARKVSPAAPSGVPRRNRR